MNNSQIVAAAAGNYVLETVGFYADVSRLDGAPFDLISFVLSSPGGAFGAPLFVVYADGSNAFLGSSLGTGTASGSLGSLAATTFTAGNPGSNVVRAYLASKPPAEVPPNTVFPFVFGLTNFVVRSAPDCAS